MRQFEIEGIATFTERGFSFESGMPTNEPVLDEAMKLHGTLKVERNACVVFVDNRRVYLPPEMHSICEGEGYRVKRTSRHYIIQMKVPVVESRKASEQRVWEMVPRVMGGITLDRKEILDV